MNKIGLIIPYFGKFNQYFQLFLNSCGDNGEFNWIVFTDDRSRYNYPENVKVYYTTFDEIRKKIQAKFDFKIMLHKPYKLCDYKIAYGYIFEDELKEYDFWGFCDVDLIWGKMNHFITEEILNQYDRLFARGHLTIFRNNYEMNHFFEKSKNEMIIDYKYAFRTKYICHFDELAYWTPVFEKYNVRQWNDIVFADVNCDKKSFELVQGTNINKPQVFHKRKDGLFRYYLDDDKVRDDEWLYVHLQKRNMAVKCSLNMLSYYIVPNQFLEATGSIDRNFIIQSCPEDRLYLERKVQRAREIFTNVKNGALRYRWRRIRWKIKNNVK